MKTNEQNALLQYLEFNLIKFIEQYEQHIIDPNIIGDMYDEAYRILNDVEQTLQAQAEIDQKISSDRDC